MCLEEQADCTRCAMMLGNSLLLGVAESAKDDMVSLQRRIQTAVEKLDIDQQDKTATLQRLYFAEQSWQELLQVKQAQPLVQLLQSQQTSRKFVTFRYQGDCAHWAFKQLHVAAGHAVLQHCPATSNVVDGFWISCLKRATNATAGGNITQPRLDASPEKWLPGLLQGPLNATTALIVEDGMSSLPYSSTPT